MANNVHFETFFKEKKVFALHVRQQLFYKWAALLDGTSFFL
jgi:hypothetical protein